MLGMPMTALGIDVGGSSVKLALVRDDGEQLAMQLTRDQAEDLELERGQIVYVRPTRETVF